MAPRAVHPSRHPQPSPPAVTPRYTHLLHHLSIGFFKALLRAKAALFSVLFLALLVTLISALLAPPLSAQTLMPTPFANDMAERTRACTAGHIEQGEGVKTTSGDVAYPALEGNRAVLLEDPTKLVQLVLYGGYGPATQGHPRPFGMPPAVLVLQDRDIAAALTHLRTRWGNQAAEVTPLQVNRIRAAQGG